MIARKIALLMWKNYHLRWYNWVMTLFEILLPIGSFYYLVRLTVEINRDPSSKISDTLFTPMSGKSIKDFVRRDEYLNLIYTPSNIFTDGIIQRVIKDLNINTTKSVASEEELESLTNAGNDGSGYWTLYSRNLSVGIVFVETTINYTNPSNFTYKIRDTRAWDTNSLFPSQDKTNYATDKYVDSGLAGLQLALDEAFLAYKHNSENGNKSQSSQLEDIYVQRFPVPEHVDENSIQAILFVIIGSIISIFVTLKWIPLIGNVIEEKQNGIKELMKLVGLKEWIIWLGWFLNSFASDLVIFTTVTILLTISLFGYNPIIVNINPCVFWLFLMMYGVANAFFSFIFCAIFHQGAVATTIYFISILGSAAITQYSISLPSLLSKELSCLLPNGAFYHGMKTLRYFELTGETTVWTLLSSTEKGVTSLSLLFVMFMLILDSILYMCLSYYITEINPGKFGAAKSPYFIFEGIVSWFLRKNSEPLINQESDMIGNKYFEKPPQGSLVSIQIKDLHKRFGDVHAVKGLNLNIYKGEITALLGHNGAGKTTVMSIMTGLTKATSGSIYYTIVDGEEIDVFKYMTRFREKIGMCAQEDRLFPYLTVIQHLLYFGMLKGASNPEANTEANEYLEMMEMREKKDCTVDELSGGQKRKLCLAISLMGKSEILILDEPTSGLDVESRRKLWNLLIKLRENRTVILTTHHMEEADALGDRIAIMHHGALVCHGTSMFLKKAYDTGYKLVITTTKSADESIITEAIHKKIEAVTRPENKIEHDTAIEIEYNLPIGELPKFSSLFEFLEKLKEGFRITNIGVSCTTMEKVFLKVGDIAASDSRAYDNSQRSQSFTAGSQTPVYKMKTGLALILQQIAALMMKKWLYVSRNYYNFCIRAMLPTLLSVALLWSIVENDDIAEPSLKYVLSTYPNSKSIGYGDLTKREMLAKYRHQVKQSGGEFVESRLADINEELLNFGKTDLYIYRYEMIAAASFNRSSSTIMYSNTALHGLPISINVYSNTLLKSVSMDINASISTVNHPIQVVKDSCPFVSSEARYIAVWFIAVSFYTVDLSAFFIEFLNIERIDGFKHMQMMANLNAVTYWIAAFIFDIVFFAAIMLSRLLIYSFFDQYGLLSINLGSIVMYSLMALYATAGMLFVYVASYVLNSKKESYSLFTYFNLAGAVVVTTIFFIDTKHPEIEFDPTISFIWLYFILKYLIYLLPPLNFSMICIKCMHIWVTNNKCKYCSSSLKTSCEDSLIREQYFVRPSYSNPSGILYDVIFLYVDMVFYAFLLGIINMGYVEKLLNSLAIQIYGDKTTIDLETELDDDVKIEHQHVEAIAKESQERGSTIYSVVAEGLRKNYIRWGFKETAVANVSFAIKERECFGLLGVNGAGKSTTFGMLTGAVFPTKGDTLIHNYRLSRHRNEYLSKVGYCPQTNCFIEELTGREMLTLMAKLRGVYPNNVKNVVDRWISILGLEEFQEQKCGTYSGGNKRKLCTAMSLIGDPLVVFLDEPTSGVDPVSRKKLYDVMQHSKAYGQTVVLTSHSMEECENLCDRLTILVAGEMKCIGTVEHLKRRYAQGFTVLIKTASITDYDTKIKVLKTAVERAYTNCVLRDEHKGLLYYHINNTRMLWSKMFKAMETLKRNFEIVEDYTITDTTLEEVFISFAKQTSNE